MANTRKFKTNSTTAEVATVEPVESVPAVEDVSEAEVASVTVVEPESETAPPEVVFSDVESTPAPRNVKVRLKRNHSCVIGGERYNFEVGKQVSVPENVKAILMRADLLLPL